MVNSRYPRQLRTEEGGMLVLSLRVPRMCVIQHGESSVVIHTVSARLVCKPRLQERGFLQNICRAVWRFCDHVRFWSLQDCVGMGGNLSSLCAAIHAVWLSWQLNEGYEYLQILRVANTWVYERKTVHNYKERERTTSRYFVTVSMLVELGLMVILLSECGTKNPSIVWERSIRLDLQCACDIRAWKPRALWNLLSISLTYNLEL